MTVIHNDLTFVVEKDRVRRNALKLLQEAKETEAGREHISLRVDHKTLLLVDKVKYDCLGKEEIVRQYQLSRRRMY
ncbi:MAG: hypothetical protein FWF54_04510 [Candidatus Azobacteroides sp.]|jgi:hypothetical protein|nr:hypothetical protein [Candidatus Azobacteroides sp.]